MRGRSRIRTRGRTGFGSLLSQATASLGTAPYHYWDFTTNRALFAQADVGPVTNTPGWSFTRASTGYAQTQSGLLVPFGSGAPRFTDKGFLIEEARTNLALWSNDMTNAAWVKVNTTAAMTQTGPDGVANSASSLTATAGNATTLQTIVSASATRAGSFWIKRLTGSGNVDIAVDGVTWSTAAVTSAWTQVSLVQAAVTNPIVGIRLVTSGDAVAVWCGQLESAGAASSPIPTTTVAVTRAADVGFVTPAGVDFPMTLYAQFNRTMATYPTNTFALSVDDGSANNRALILVLLTSSLINPVITAGGAAQYSFVTSPALAANTTAKVALRVATSGAATALDNTLQGPGGAISVPGTPTTIHMGTNQNPNGQLSGYLRRAAIFNTALADAPLQRTTL